MRHTYHYAFFCNPRKFGDSLFKFFKRDVFKHLKRAGNIKRIILGGYRRYRANDIRVQIFGNIERLIFDICIPFYKIAEDTVADAYLEYRSRFEAKHFLKLPIIAGEALFKAILAKFVMFFIYLY